MSEKSYDTKNLCQCQVRESSQGRPTPAKARGTLNPLAPYTRHVKFYYPSKHHVVKTTLQEEEKDPATSVGATLDEVNYGYTWRTENDFPWEPLAVFDDGSRVYLRLPDTIDTGGVLLLGTEGESKPGTYILREDFLIIECLFDEARIVVPGPLKRKRLFAKKRQSQRVLIISTQAS